MAQLLENMALFLLLKTKHFTRIHEASFKNYVRTAKLTKIIKSAASLMGTTYNYPLNFVCLYFNLTSR